MKGENGEKKERKFKKMADVCVVFNKTIEWMGQWNQVPTSLWINLVKRSAWIEMEKGCSLDKKKSADPLIKYRPWTA